MKKAIEILWSLTVIGIVIFGIAIFTVNSDVMLWRIFSIVMPVVGIGFLGAVILSLVDFVRSRKENL